MANTFKNYRKGAVGNATLTVPVVTELITALVSTMITIIGLAISNTLSTGLSINVSAALARKLTGSTNWLSRTSTTVTVTWAGHGFSVGDWVLITGSGVTSLDGLYQIVTTPTADTFTYTSGTSGSTTASIGTGYHLVFLVKDAPVPSGNSLVVVGADQKVCMNYSATAGQNDVLLVYTNTTSAASVIASTLEIT